MKLFPKTVKEFGITCDNEQLRIFNKNYLEFFPKMDSESKRKAFLWIASIISFALDVYFGIRCLWHNPWLTVTVIVPLTGAFFFVFFINKKEYDYILKRRIKYCLLAIQPLLIAPNLVSIYRDSIIEYLSYMILFAIGCGIGLLTWGRRMMKQYKISYEKQKFNAALSTGLGSCGAVLVVPIISAFKNQKDVLWVLLVICIAMLSALFGWAFGLGIQNIRYYIFLQNEGKNRTQEI